jgi:NhaA family Na+:H+ antiporter
MSKGTRPPGSSSPPRRRPPALGEFLSVETAGGLVLVAAVIAAIVWANVSPAAYASFWASEITLGVGDVSISETLAHWVTEGLMTIFFFVVGLEIKRELVVGELRDPRRAALPVVAALGGMVVPAALFVAVNLGRPSVDGWGIPMATDIAFAVAVVALLGSRVPRPLKLFLLTLAIVDDIGAIVVIALFYSHGVSFAWLLGGALVLLAMVGMRVVGIARPLVYVLPGAIIWYCFLESGIHPTLSGVLLGLLTPTGEAGGRPVIEQLEHRLHPWSSLVIVPLFALASAGVLLDVEAIQRAADSPVSWGVVLGLVVGKPLGIFVATATAVRLGIGRLPSQLGLRHVLGAGCLAGIGFTVSLFVADLAFVGALLRDAKLGILAASVASALIGIAVLATLAARHRPPSPHDPSAAGCP